ncbi:hypothetical protein CIG75_15520 [Tumebacillus algifaecis]|uniref:DUF4064 domain-containing protein n=1 Tax=Tumebacillus algifaecis TaxID=1214604 RepID=A0A223D3U3_9BACL|nr:DUF4064 domain-containing protein [Tumebacillus algifaecis]ASS76210.1 hypothetical protein CIG75_15520 [Tumebacillus algifaecis]
MKRTAEFGLGLAGGILGILFALAGVFFGEVAQSLAVEEGGLVAGLSWIALLFSVLGIIGAVLVRKKTVLASILMLVAAIGGFVCISFFYILPGILLIIAGIMGLVRKDKGLPE